MIELDLAVPWQPPERIRRRPRPAWQRRLPGAALAVVLVLGLPAAGAPARGDGPAYEIEHRVLSVDAAPGRLFVARFPASVLEARDLRDGTTLWTVSIQLSQHFAFATAGVVVLTSEYGDHSPEASIVTALDAATGAELWHVASSRVVGRIDGRILLEDLTEVPGQDAAGTMEPWPGKDPAANRAPLQRDARYVQLDERTGRTLWRVDVPAGSLADFTWRQGDPYRLQSFTELSPSGLLQVRGIGSGAVLERHQLDWSGTISTYSDEDAGASGPGQVVVYTAGQVGAEVFDRATGARLWGWTGALHSGLFRCSPGRFCSTGESGIDSIDAGTGRVVWHLDGFNSVEWLDEHTVVLGSYAQGTPESDVLLVADPQTGRIRRRLSGWQAVNNPAGRRAIVWRPLDDRSALLGTLDPRTGNVAVFGRAGGWFGRPECVIAAGSMACVLVGALSVWRLPPAAGA